MALLHVRFWGVRGSIPAPGAATVGFGGNTSCVEIRAGDDVCLFDMGSGLRAYGQSLGRAPAKASIFLSHYHWDHIQGFPFFGPAYNPASQLEVYGPVREGRDVRALLAGQMVPPYFPVPIEAFRAKIAFHTVVAGQPVTVGGIKVIPSELNHPNGVLAYRVEHGGKAVVYATDNEHGTAGADAALVDLSRGAEALIYDAMYTDDEYVSGKTGWGHSTWTEGLKILEKSGCKRLVLFHHEPTRSDQDLEGLLSATKAHGGAALVAREGETLSF